MSSTFTRGQPSHARVYDLLCGWQERGGLLEWRRTLVSDLTGDVVELGAGTGRNFRFYQADTHILASDLDPVMLERAKARAHEARADVELFLADAQSLPFPDRSVDTVVIGLMLCSVPNVDKTLAEARRVLKADGRLRFLEHVRSPKGKLLARAQDVVNPAWRRVSGGCNMNRRTADRIVEAGFRLQRLHHFRAGVVPLLAPHIMGEAVRDPRPGGEAATDIEKLPVE